MHRIARIPLTVVVVIAVAACSAASRSATPLASPSSAPTPSPTPDVGALFRDAYAGISSGVIEMEGSATVGSVRVTLEETQTFNGPDNEESTTSTIAGVATTTQLIMAGGSQYRKVGEGPWLADASTASSPGFDQALRRLAGSVKDEGVTTFGSVAAHRLVPHSDSMLDPSLLGLGGVGVTGITSTVTFFAADDGTPVGLELALSWLQPAGTSSVPAKVEMSAKFAKLGEKLTIRAPTHVWPVYNSPTMQYGMAHPEDWDTSTEKDVEYFDGPNGEYVATSWVELPKGWTLNELGTASAAQMKKDWAGTTPTNDGITIDGQRARLLSTTGSDGSKHPVVVYEAIVIVDKYVYVFDWVSAPGTETRDLDTFKQMLSTVTFRLLPQPSVPGA